MRVCAHWVFMFRGDRDMECMGRQTWIHTQQPCILLWHPTSMKV